MNKKRVISSIVLVVYLGIFFFRHKLNIGHPFFSAVGAICVIVLYFLVNSFRIRITRQ